MGGEAGVRKPLIILLLASFIVNLGFSALSPVFPYLVLALKGVLRELPELTAGAIQAHLGAIEFGFLMAAFMATRAPIAMFSGFLSDLFGRKRTMILGMTLYLIATIGFILAQDIPTLIIFRAVQGAASAMVWPVAEAYLADITGRWQRGKALSAYVASMLIAELIGPGIGVAVYKAWCILLGGADYVMALKSPIIFLAFASLISLITLAFLPKVSKRSSSGGIKAGFADVKRIFGSLPRTVSRSLKTMYFNGAVNGLGMGILQTALIVYVIELIVKDPAYLGVYYTVTSAAALPATILSGYITDKLKRRKPMIILGYVVGRGVFFLVPLTRDPITLLLLAIPASMTFGISVPAMRALQADLTPKEIRGSVFGIQQFFMNGGVLAGSILGGWLTQILAEEVYQIASYRIQGIALPFWITGALGTLTTILFIIYVEEPR
ncbi:MAG: MFS transporter [Thaumarchaeota archaeon]|nr:MFS transporter [Nitrososphaerota archaeon]